MEFICAILFLVCIVVAFVLSNQYEQSKVTRFFIVASLLAALILSITTVIND